MTAPRRLRAILKYKKDNIALLLVLAQFIHDKMLASQALYTGAPVTPAALLLLIVALATAQQGVRNRTVTAADRNVKRDALVTALETLRMFVQGLSDTSPEQGAALIDGAGMTVAPVPKRSKPLLAAKLGKVSGIVDLIANAGLLSKTRLRRYYGWQYTIDGGKTWITAPSTPYARTTITGLPALTVCGFRVNVTDPTGPTEWSQVITIVVH